MTKSPCIGCEFEFVDKNNPTCRECDKRVEYVALIAGDGGSVMGETKETGAGDQRSGIRSRKPKRSDTICLIGDCDFKTLNRGLCSMHYQQWRLGKIVHPVLGKFTVSQARIRSKAKTNLVKKAPVKKKEVKKQKSEVGSRKSERAAPAEVKKAALPPLVAVQLSLYPEIHKAVYDTAEKYFVTPEHVIISLLGEALAARTRLRDASPGEERP